MESHDRPGTKVTWHNNEGKDFSTGPLVKLVNQTGSLIITQLRDTNILIAQY